MATEPKPVSQSAAPPATAPAVTPGEAAAAAAGADTLTDEERAALAAEASRQEDA